MYVIIGTRSRAKDRERKARNQGLKSEAKRTSFLMTVVKNAKIGELRGKCSSRYNLFGKRRISYATQGVPDLTNLLIIKYPNKIIKQRKLYRKKYMI